MKRTFIIACLLMAQQFFAQRDQQLSKQQISEAVAEATIALNDQYVFPDVARQMAAHIAKANKSGKYRSLTGSVLADRLTHDLQEISHDGHVRVIYSEEVLPPSDNKVKMYIPEEEKEQYNMMLKHTNYGINKLDILPGNIGYIDFSYFCDPEFASTIYSSALNYVTHTDALIIDLRHCGGSYSPEAVPYICSYFFDKPTHLNTLYWRGNQQPTETRTSEKVIGAKYLDKPIYILTGGSTFSGAEAMAYDFKAIGRATIVGAATGGGANAGGIVRITDHFSMFIPIGKAVNPITKSNWEVHGVQPDVEVNSHLALHKAQELALEKMLTNKNDQYWQPELKRLLADNKKNAPKMGKVTFELSGYDTAKEVFVSGSFNDWAPKGRRMERKGDKWVATAESIPGKINYKFVVDGRWITDPGNPQTEGEGEMANSVVMLPGN